MTTLKLTSDDRTLEFKVSTTAKVTSYRGTKFIPNNVRVRILGGKVLSISVSRLDGSGYGIDDPAGPDGAELAADFGGGELLPSARADLPKVVQDVLAEVEKLTGK